MNHAAGNSITGLTIGGRCQGEQAEIQFLKFFASNILKP
jgi:hypothetical protein